MPVAFKGGTSGNREDALPNVSVAFDKQVPQNTAGGSSGSNVQWSQNSGNREGDHNPPVPESGTPDDSAV